MNSVICGLIGLLGGASDPPVVLDLWPGGPPGGARDFGAEEERMRPGDRPVAGRPVLRLDNVAVPRVHVFLPPTAERQGTLVVVCPGGGFNHLAWELEGTEAAEWLGGLGVAAAVLTYRVPTMEEKPVWLAPVQDAQRALSLMRSRAPEWGLDPSRIGVLGFSAGGLVAAHMVLQHEERSYVAADDVDRVAFRPDFAVLVYPGGLIDRTGRLRAELAVPRDAPPCFLVQAADDQWGCENSTEFFLALKAAAVPAELHLYAAGGHGYGLRPHAELPVTT